MSALGETVAVAIDFGATYSGIALIGIESRKFVQLGQWPGQPESSNSYKVPTIVAYPGDGGPPLWGFEAEQSTDNTYPKLRVFKPYLDPELTHQYRTPPGKELSDVVHDYIHGLFTHLVRYLEGRATFRGIPDLNFLLTVPATFGDSAIEKFRQIIKTTGIGDHNFSIGLTEPEAAGLYTMQAMALQTNSLFNQNDCFIVCDAGGGTVDLSSYNTVESDPTRFRHTEVVSGKYCGSTIIDREFISYVIDLIGEDRWRDLGAVADLLTKRFIAEKERFDNSEEIFNIFLGDIPCPGKKGHYLPIPRQKMVDFFGKSLIEIQGMIRAHIRQCAANGFRVGSIFLVGGLGSSPYTKKKIEEYCHEIDPDIDVIQPSDAQHAVVRGAITSHMRSLRREEDPVQTRLCRKSYGLLVSKTFDKIKNFDIEKVEDPISGEILAKDQIEWLVQKGDRITGGPERCAEREFIREFIWKSVEHKSGWKEVLVEYSGDHPPFRADPGVSKLCIVSVNLPQSDFKRVEKKMPGFFSKPLKYFRAKYTIKIYAGTTGVRVEFFYKGELRPELAEVTWVN